MHYSMLYGQCGPCLVTRPHGRFRKDSQDSGPQPTPLVVLSGSTPPKVVFRSNLRRNFRVPMRLTAFPFALHGPSDIISHLKARIGHCAREESRPPCSASHLANHVIDRSRVYGLAFLRSECSRCNLRFVKTSKDSGANVPKMVKPGVLIKSRLGVSSARHRLGLLQQRDVGSEIKAGNKFVHLFSDCSFILGRVKFLCYRHLTPNHVPAKIKELGSGSAVGHLDRANKEVLACPWVPREREASRFIGKYVSSSHETREAY
jgi:hypothetical protein